MLHIEAWKFLAGLGFFLYGMSQLETVLKNVSGRSLKLFLKRNTQNLFKAVFGGAIITGIVQSSSVVSLLVLAFVESGVITFRNALGVILGTNLGTTLDSWIVATIGFKVNITSYSLPIIAVTLIGMFFFEKRKNLYNLLSIFFALGILFLGLSFMKEGALQLVKDFDLTEYKHYNSFILVFIGFILTTIIQSSSATVAIALTAIYAGVLTLPSAAAIVIGAEVGTTIKILLWGLNGSADKKRVALGNFIYNIFTASIALFFLNWLIYFIRDFLRITNPLIGLVFFQTAINALAIILFVPFLNVFSKWLETKFEANLNKSKNHLSTNLYPLPFQAAEALRNESVKLLKKTILFIRGVLCIEEPLAEGILSNLQSLTRTYPDLEEEYNRLKQIEGDILAYYASIQQNHFSAEDTTLMLQYVHAFRESVHAAKSIKDITHNLEEFEASANDVLHHQCANICDEWTTFQLTFDDLLISKNISVVEAGIEKLLTDALAQDAKRKLEVISHLKNDSLNEVEASTLMNVNHGLLSTKRSLLSALSDTQTE